MPESFGLIHFLFFFFDGKRINLDLFNKIKKYFKTITSKGEITAPQTIWWGRGEGEGRAREESGGGFGAFGRGEGGGGGQDSLSFFLRGGGGEAHLLEGERVLNHFC